MRDQLLKTLKIFGESKLLFGFSSIIISHFCWFESDIYHYLL